MVEPEKLREFLRGLIGQYLLHGTNMSGSGHSITSETSFFSNSSGFDLWVRAAVEEQNLKVPTQRGLLVAYLAGELMLGSPISLPMSPSTRRSHVQRWD